VGKNVKKHLPDLLSGVKLVTPEVFDQLIQQTGASPAYLKKLLRESNVPLHPLIEGVRQDTPDNLSRTLAALAAIYSDQPKATRLNVLESKRHTRLLLAKQLMSLGETMSSSTSIPGSKIPRSTRNGLIS